MSSDTARIIKRFIDASPLHLSFAFEAIRRQAHETAHTEMSPEWERAIITLDTWKEIASDFQELQMNSNAKV